MAKIMHEDEFVKDYKGYSIYKNSKYNKWLDNGRYLLTRGSMLRAFDSIKACERWVNQYQTPVIKYRPDLVTQDGQEIYIKTTAKPDRKPLTQADIYASLTKGIIPESDLDNE